VAAKSSLSLSACALATSAFFYLNSHFALFNIFIERVFERIKNFLLVLKAAQVASFTSEGTFPASKKKHFLKLLLFSI
jgi:hypothetical protein